MGQEEGRGTGGDEGPEPRLTLSGRTPPCTGRGSSLHWSRTAPAAGKLCLPWAPGKGLTWRGFRRPSASTLREPQVLTWEGAAVFILWLRVLQPRRLPAPLPDVAAWRVGWKRKCPDLPVEKQTPAPYCLLGGERVCTAKGRLCYPSRVSGKKCEGC